MSVRPAPIFRGVFGNGPRGLLPEERGDWDESKHPRRSDGKFGSGGGGSVKASQTSFSFNFTNPDSKPKAPAPAPPKAAPTKVEPPSKSEPKTVAPPKPVPEPKPAPAPRSAKMTASILKVSDSRSARAYDLNEGGVRVRGYTIQKKPGMASFHVAPDGSGTLVAVSQSGLRLPYNVKTPGPEHMPGVILAGIKHIHSKSGVPIAVSDRATPEVKAAVDALVKHGLVKRMVAPNGKDVLVPVNRTELPAAAKPKLEVVPKGQGDLAVGDKDKHPGSDKVHGIASQAPGSLERRVREIEYHELAHLEKERACAYDADGKTLVLKGGTKNKVPFTADEVAKMKGGILTHNHPGGYGSFSVADLKLASVADLKEIRAVDRHRGEDGKMHTYLYRAVRPDNGWPPAKGIAGAYKIHSRGNEVQMHIVGRIRRNELTLAEGNEKLRAEVGHAVWVRVAQSRGFKYERVQLD